MAVDVDAILGFGTILEVNRGTGFETIAGLYEIGEFGPEADDVERTTHGSPGGFRRFARGLLDPGTMTFSGYWVAHPSQLGMIQETQGEFVYEAEYPYRITLPNGMGQWAGGGFLKTTKFNPQMDANLEFNGEIRLSGQGVFTVTFAAGLTTPFFVVSTATDTVPAKAQSTTSYVVNVPTGSASVTITPTAAVGIITVNGTTVATGVASGAVALGSAGSITRAHIEVAEDGKATKTYTLDIVRATT